MTTPTELSIHNGARWGLRLDNVWSSSENLPDEQKGALRWLDAHARENNMSKREVARLLFKEDGSNYSEETVYQIMTGRHASVGNFVRAVANFQKPFAERRTTEDFPFVETALAKSIFDYCDSTIRHRKIGSIFGENQVGKTAALKQYAADRPHGQVIYVRMPTGGQQSQFVMRLCRTFNMSSKNRLGFQKERIFDLFKPTMLLIVDELHQCFWGSAPRLRTIEFIREIFDECRCPVVVCGTNVARSGIYEDEENKTFFGQFRNRGIEPYVLRNQSKPTKKDLNLFAKKLDLAAAEGEALTLQTVVIDKFGLGKWLTYLMTGRTNAQNAGHKMTWADVLTAADTFSEIAGEK